MAQTADARDKDPARTSYRPADHIRWSVEQAGLLLFDQKTGRAAAIAYPQAAVWDFLTRQYPVARIIRLLGCIADLDSAKALELLQNSLAIWLKAGYLIRRDDHG